MQITLLSLLDYAGVATFAASGALMAAEKRQDILTFIFFAAITGVGGGTLRDLMIGAPVFWVVDPGYSIVCGAMRCSAGSRPGGDCRAARRSGSTSAGAARLHYVGGVTRPVPE